MEGWRNKLIPPSHLKSLIDEIGKERTSICSDCPYNSAVRHKTLGYSTIRPDEHCTICGCTLSAKTKCLSCNCPIDKWHSVSTPEQEEELKKNINENNKDSS